MCIRDRDISIHGSVITTSGFGKQTAAMLEFYFRLRFSHICRQRQLNLRRLTKFHPNRTTPWELWRHIDFSRWRSWSRKSTSGFQLGGCANFRRSTSICTLNFDEMPQSAADILLLPVSENTWLIYWKCTSGLQFGLTYSFEMTPSIILPSFINKRPFTHLSQIQYGVGRHLIFVMQCY